MASKKKNNPVLSTHLEYQSPWFAIYKELIHYPNGLEKDYYLLTRPNHFVCIIAVEGESVLVLRQWRPTLRRWHYEFPMGGINENESPLKAAKRECLEETGYKARKWQKIGRFYVGPGHTNQIGFVYLASELVKITGKAENNPSELIKVKRIAIKELDTMIEGGLFTD